MAVLFLVRHGPSAVRPDVAAHNWELDPDRIGAVDALRDSGRLPAEAPWFSSPEPKALQTAHRLSDQDITVVEALREHERGPTSWFDDVAEWRAVVRRAFTDPDRPALAGWEPLTATRDRLVPAVRRLVADNPERDIVLVGHGTAWTLLVSELTDDPPDLDAWAEMQMPDLWTVDLPAAS